MGASAPLILCKKENRMSTVQSVKLKTPSGDYLYPESYGAVLNMPTASAALADVIVTYIGTTVASGQVNEISFVKGDTYICAINDPYASMDDPFLEDYQWWTYATPYTKSERSYVYNRIQDVQDNLDNLDPWLSSIDSTVQILDSSLTGHTNDSGRHINTDDFMYMSMPSGGMVLMSTDTDSVGSASLSWRWGDIIKPLSPGATNTIDIVGNLLYTLDTTGIENTTEIVFDLGAGEKDSLSQPCSFGLFITHGATVPSIHISTSNEYNAILWSREGTNPPVFSEGGGVSISTANRSYMLRFFWVPSLYKLLGTCAFSVDA